MTANYLVFGDLHGRILPAFQLARKWSRDHEIALDGILQVGDLGYFPDPNRLDKATRRHAERDPSELGAQLIVQPSTEGDAIFYASVLPPLWFVAGNHEDFEALEERMSQGVSGMSDFPVDCYEHVWCIRDGRVASLPGGLDVGGLWGIDDQSPRARRGGVPQRGYIRPRSATHLAVSKFDVLLTHDSPRDAIFEGAGSDLISEIIQMANPTFAFFGHYHAEARMVDCDFKFTQAYHLAAFELRGENGAAESGSVGWLTWFDGKGTFSYLDDEWLRHFTRFSCRS